MGRYPFEAISEAEALAERFEHRDCRAELHRLRGVFLATLGAEGSQLRLRSAQHKNRKGAEVGFAGETRRRNLHRISHAKSERVRRTWIPTISLVVV